MFQFFATIFATISLTIPVAAGAQANSQEKIVTEIVNGHSYCAAYYETQPRGQARSKQHIEAGAEWLEVFYKMDRPKANSWITSKATNIVQKVTKDFGGTFSDPRIGIDFDVMCGKIHPGLSSSDGRVKPELLAAARNATDAVIEEIVVKTLTGKTIRIDSRELKTVKDLKNAILDKEGIPAEQQRLIYSGRQLENDIPIVAYNITSGATVHLILRLREP